MDEVEAVGFAMWKAEADRAAPNVGKNRAIENYRYDLDPTSRAKWDQIAQAAIAALDAARGDQVAEVERLREENYRAFTDGMEAAAQICGSLAEVEYDDADGFDAATGCEAAIMRVVKDQRREQAALGASHDADA